MFQDISAQKSLEQQKNEFISMTSHELRTPITAIQGFAELLQIGVSQQQGLASPRSQRALQQIVKQSQHLTTLIEGMLDLTRIEQVRFTVMRTPHDVLRILADVVESFVATTHDHSLHFVVEGLETSETLMSNVDGGRMVQVFSNLISNAIKYSPTASVIEVGLRAKIQSSTSEEVLIWVKDQGIGISASEIPHVFQRFHRVSTLDSTINGLGIGLYLVKEIVSRHHGRVWVESAEGRGSTFYVLLPLTSD